MPITAPCARAGVSEQLPQQRVAGSASSGGYDAMAGLAVQARVWSEQLTKSVSRQSISGNGLIKMLPTRPWQVHIKHGQELHVAEDNIEKI